jgi:hypothetical protein
LPRWTLASSTSRRSPSALVESQEKYRAVVVASDVLPPLDNVVGVATVDNRRGDFIRAVIRARRRRCNS